MVKHVLLTRCWTKMFDRYFNSCTKMLADLILHSKRHISPSENNGN